MSDPLSTDRISSAKAYDCAIEKVAYPLSTDPTQTTSNSSSVKIPVSIDNN